MIALVLLGLVLMAVAALIALALLGEWMDSRRAVRWCHTIGRHCGRSSCEPCKIAAKSAEAAAKVGAQPVLVVPVVLPWPPIPGAYTRVT